MRLGSKDDKLYANRENFIRSLASRSRESDSRIILALDLDYRRDISNLLKDAKHILRETSEYLCAVKINFHLLLPLSLSEMTELNESIRSQGLVSIADIKLNDIDNTNRVATEYLWDSGFSAVIVNPFAGLEGGLDIVFSRARKMGKGVITLAYMSHKGADEGYGLALRDGKTIFDLFLERALSWKSDGIILGTTRPEKIAYAKNRLQDSIKIFSPGSGSQGGDPTTSLKAGADYLIFGRQIVDSKDPHETAKQIFEKLFVQKEKG